MPLLLTHRPSKVNVWAFNPVIMTAIYNQEWLAFRRPKAVGGTWSSFSAAPSVVWVSFWPACRLWPTLVLLLLLLRWPFCGPALFVILPPSPTSANLRPIVVHSRSSHSQDLSHHPLATSHEHHPRHSAHPTTQEQKLRRARSRWSMANATDNGTVLHAIDFHSSLLFTVWMWWLQRIEGMGRRRWRAVGMWVSLAYRHCHWFGVYAFWLHFRKLIIFSIYSWELFQESWSF